MIQETVSQQKPECSEVVMSVLAGSPVPLLFPQLLDKVRSLRKFTPTQIRAALAELEDDDLVDYEQPGLAATRTYFLSSRPPKMGAIIIPAAAAPRVRIPPSTWYSSLAVAA